MSDIVEGTVKGRIFSVIASVARRHDVEASWTMTGSLVDGGLTSVAMVEVMLEVERAFDLTLPDNELNAANFFSVATLVAMLDRIIANQARTACSHASTNIEADMLSSQAVCRLP